MMPHHTDNDGVRQFGRHKAGSGRSAGPASSAANSTASNTACSTAVPRVFDVVPTQSGYDLWAATYDDDENILIRLEDEHLQPIIGPVSGLDVADLGCGTGRQALRLAGAGARVTAVDQSLGMVRRAAGKAGWDRVRFVEHDLTRPLPFKDHSFDLVLASLVIEHLPDLAAFYRECCRIGRPGAAVWLTAMHPAMLLRGVEAHFKDPASGREVRPQSYAHQISDYVMAAVNANVRLDWLSEHQVSDEMAEISHRAEKYHGWPLLLMLRLRCGKP